MTSRHPKPPAHGSHLIVDFPSEKVIRLTLKRPRQLNTLNDALLRDIENVMDWYETEPSLWVSIITGTGRYFCAGQDLKDWLIRAQAPESDKDESSRIAQNAHGFASLSRRFSTKPMIIALNGSALGGGAEIVSNGDLVVGVESGVMGFPEVKRGVIAGQGALPLLSHSIPHAIASQLFLLGEPISFTEAKRWGIINEVAKTPEDVMKIALRWAESIKKNAPESVQLSKRSLHATRNGFNLEENVVGLTNSGWHDVLTTSKNYKEGLTAFTEKRQPVWTDPHPSALTISDGKTKWPVRLDYPNKFPGAKL